MRSNLGDCWTLLAALSALPNTMVIAHLLPALGALTKMTHCVVLYNTTLTAAAPDARSSW